MQDAVIGMAILVVVLALWRLHSRPKLFGGLGPWAETNIFGAETLDLIPGGGQGRGRGESLAPFDAPASFSNQAGLLTTNQPAAPASHKPGIAGHSASNGANRLPASRVSTNLLNTNGPVTLMAVAPSDLMETPPGAAAAVNVPEAADLERRLGEVSAKGGDIQISLSWHNYNDLDLHCVDPAGEEIFFAHRMSARTGGELDIDQNARPPYILAPVENIYWPVGGAPPGLYRIYVVYYAPHCETDATPFLARVLARGQSNYFKGTIIYTGQRERKLICNLRYDPANPNPAQRLRYK